MSTFLGVFGASVADELVADGSEGLVLAAAVKLQGDWRGGGVRGGGFDRRRMDAGEPMMADGWIRSMACRWRRRWTAVGAAGIDFRQFAEAAKGEAEPAAGRRDLVRPTVRSNFADTASGSQRLTTDAERHRRSRSTMPENLTGLEDQRLGHGPRHAKVGEGDAEVVTRKNLIVRLQAPRFFVQKDEVVLSANVHNYLKTDKEVASSLDLAGDSGLLGPKATRHARRSRSQPAASNASIGA